jgi:tetratricopeptide (TPR) repeat protein
MISSQILHRPAGMQGTPAGTRKSPKDIMTAHFSRLPRALVAAASLMIGLAGSAYGDDARDSDASAHVLQAEIALHRMDYLEAAREYRLAAESSESVEIARQATNIGASYGFYDEAIKSAQRWLELEPDNDEALFHLARLQLRSGDTRGAVKSYKELLSHGEGPEDQRLLSLTGVLGEEEDTEAAYEVMRTLAKPYKDSAAASYATAVTAVQASEIEDARKYVEEALALDPDEWLEMRVKLLHGRILLLEGKDDEAIDYVATMIGDDPQPDPSARMELALLMLSVGREDDALSQVNQIQYETGSNPDALRLMAIINFRQDNLDAAREDFEDLLASGEHSMDALFYLARIADSEGETDRAISLYSQVTSGDNAVTSQRRAAALIAIDKKAPAMALDKLDEFAREQPQYAVDMVQSKAQLLAALERYGEALEYYDRMAEFRPDSESVVLGRAELLLRMGELDQAIDQYEVAVKRWPDSALSLNALGYTLADRTDEYRQAEKLIRKAIKLDPENPAIIDSLGWVLYKLGRHEEALVELERAYEMFDDPEVAAHIVEVLAAMEREDEALEILEKAEEKTPDSKLLASVRDRIFPDADE